MPIIQVERKQAKNQIKTSIESDVQDSLRAYCRYSGATSDQVVSGALKFLFQNDTEFKPWYEAHKNDSHPRRGPRKRIPDNGTENAATASQDKSTPISALKK